MLEAVLPVFLPCDERVVIFLVVVIKPASNLRNMNVRCSDLFEDVINRNHRLSVSTACVDVQSHIVDFGPCVAGKMRLTDYYYSAYSIGGKPVERHRPDLSMCTVGGLNENILKFGYVGDCFITAGNFNDIVNTFRGQFRISASLKIL